ncbi:MAG: acetate uptake transporter [Nitrospira sp.]
MSEAGLQHHRRIDVLAIGLFGLAVGAVTLGVAQLGGIPDSNKVGTLVIALMFGGIVQILAGITDIRYHEQLGGTALTMYGFFWTTVCIAKLVSESTSFRLDQVLYAPINVVYAAFSAVMIYLTAYKNATLCILHVVITITFSSTVLARLGFIGETFPGVLHIVVGVMAFYHAVASLTQAFTGHQLVPLGPPFFHRTPLRRRATDVHSPAA